MKNQFYEQLLKYGFKDISTSENLPEGTLFETGVLETCPIRLLFSEDFLTYTIFAYDIMYDDEYTVQIDLPLAKIIYKYMLSKQPTTELDLKTYMGGQFYFGGEEDV